MPEDQQEPTLEKVLARENLQEAWRSVKANRGAGGVDGMDIEQTGKHLLENWESIVVKLHRGEYRPGALRAKAIQKSNGGERTLGIPTVLDRVIQQAISQVLTPEWEPEFSDRSYGYRPNRSAHDAVREAQSYVKEGKTWVVDIDLKSFFDQVNHDKLMHLLNSHVTEKSLRTLIGAYLRAPWKRAGGKLEKRTKGIPQGMPLSPLLANIYLDPLDKELEKRGLSFVRYADDIAIYVSSKRSAERVYKSVSDWIEKNLKVEVNREKSGSGPNDQSSLLGFRIRTDGTIEVASEKIVKLKKKVRELWEARQNLTSKELRDQWQRYIRGWWGYFRLTERRWEVTDLSGWMRRHMRKCFWLRWRTPRGRINALRRLGVKGRSLGNGYCSKGAWPMSRHFVMQQSLNNKTLKRYGFTLPWEVAEA